MTGEQVLNIMETKLQEAGAEVIDKKRFKGMVKLGIKDAVKFGEQINELII